MRFPATRRRPWDEPRVPVWPNLAHSPKEDCRIGPPCQRMLYGMAKGKGQRVKGKWHICHLPFAICPFVGSLRESSFFPCFRVPEFVLKQKVGFAQLAFKRTVFTVALAHDTIPFFITPPVREWASELTYSIMYGGIKCRRGACFSPFIHPLKNDAADTIAHAWPAAQIPFNIFPGAAQVLGLKRFGNHFRPMTMVSGATEFRNKYGFTPFVLSIAPKTVAHSVRPAVRVGAKDIDIRTKFRGFIDKLQISIGQSHRVIGI